MEEALEQKLKTFFILVIMGKWLRSKSNLFFIYSNCSNGK